MDSEGNNRAVAGRALHSTPSLLRNLRNLRILVFHPRDADGELLTQQLQRIGCQVITMWPPLPDLPDTVDVVFCAVRPDHSANQCNWMVPESAIPLIALISYENPTIIDAAMRMGALSVLASPLRSTGILSALAIAKHTHEERHELQRRVARLQQKLHGANQISQAKAILVRTRSISDDEAYRIIREQAMSKRITTEDIARSIIHADGVLSYRPKGNA
ncbi:MAG: ANTAR domain-containing protein [Rubrivivax sp.]|nr:ANTAR domain-containing protein [Rubrivivax sp.]